MCRSILSLSEIAHKMWRDHPFSQRNRTTERTVGLGFESDKEVGGDGGIKQNFKKGVDNIGGMGLDQIGC